MSRAFRWFMDNTLIAATIVAAVALSAWVYQAREISATDYQNLSRMYEEGSSELKQHVREEFADGKISRWSYVALFRQALQYRAVEIYTKAEGSLEQERERLRKVIAKDFADG